MKITSMTRDEIIGYLHTGEIIEELYSLVRKFCYSVNDYSEDLVQELIIEVIDKIDKFDEKRAKFSTWLFKVCQNKRFMIGRMKLAKKRNNAHSTLPLNAIADDDDTEYIDLLLDESDPDIFYKHLVTRKIYTQLSDISRKYFEGAKQSDLAKEYNISQAQVSRIVKKEIENIKKKLDL